jgi:peptide-methionine (R)-S-oxide reductase
MTDSQRTGSAAEKVRKTDSEWRAQLTPEQYYVTRAHGTERAGTSPLNREKRQGVFACVCCGEPLFVSNAKFDSGTGWPSFDRPADAAAVSEHDDNSLFMRRTEVRCASCEAHLGHVFPDGPRDTTGLRYCINGVALKFKPADT